MNSRLTFPVENKCLKLEESDKILSSAVPITISSALLILNLVVVVDLLGVYIDCSKIQFYIIYNFIYASSLALTLPIKSPSSNSGK